MRSPEIRTVRSASCAPPRETTSADTAAPGSTIVTPDNRNRRGGADRGQLGFRPKHADGKHRSDDQHRDRARGRSAFDETSNRHSGEKMRARLAKIIGCGDP
jgi:hypothetical protein